MHLIGISTDASGKLIRLFTTNRWVTDEVWYGADAVIDMLDWFDMTCDTPSRELNRWIGGVSGCSAADCRSDPRCVTEQSPAIRQRTRSATCSRTAACR